MHIYCKFRRDEFKGIYSQVSMCRIKVVYDPTDFSGMTSNVISLIRLPIYIRNNFTAVKSIIFMWSKGINQEMNPFIVTNSNSMLICCYTLQ